MARGVRQWVAIGLGLYTCAAIAGTCYVTIEVLRLHGTAQNLTIGGGLVVLLGPALYLLWRLSPEGTQVAWQHDFARRERQRIDARVAELRGDPRREQFLPLVQRGYHLTDEQLAKWLVRIDELAAVPHRKRYIEQLLEGREFSDEQIDYLEFPERLVTCEHLQPVERALKQGGQRLSLCGPRHVRAVCQLRFDALRAKFALPDFLENIDVMVNWRDNIVDQRLRCGRCDSEIQGEGYGQPWPA